MAGRRGRRPLRILPKVRYFSAPSSEGAFIGPSRTPVPTNSTEGAVFFAPSLRGLDFAKQKTGGVYSLRTTLPPVSLTLNHLPQRGREIYRRRRCHFALQNDRVVREADPYEFYRGCGIFRPLSEGAGFCEAKDWGSVVLKEYTPSVFAYGEASRLRAAPVAALTVPRTVIHYRDCASLTLREGGYFIAALRRCHFARQNDREGQAPPLHRRSTRHTATFSASGKYRLCLGFSSPHKGHSPLRGPHFQVQK